MKFPTLYKKTNTGALQFWEIETGEYDSIAYFTTTYGQLGTDSPQETTDYIEKGKNIGKKNETTPLQQADAEAKAKYDKQLKKGYVTSKEAAEAGKIDNLIEGGINVMLAHKFAEHGHKIKFPAYISRKLDGLRIVAILEDGKCSLWSRTRKPVNSLPHIVAEIERVFPGQTLTLDGEAYRHSMNDNFEKLVSLVRQEEADEDHDLVEYHVFDVVNTEPLRIDMDGSQRTSREVKFLSW